MLSYYRSDELPQWVATISVNGTTYNYTTGWTFTLKLSLGSADPVLTKTTNITGAASGVVTVAWAAGDLDITPGTYRALLIARRTSDGAEHTVKESIQVTDRG